MFRPVAAWCRGLHNEKSDLTHIVLRGIMKRRSSGFVLLLLFFPAVLLEQEPARRKQPENTINLRDGWALQSSAKTGETGDILSTSQFQPKGWYAVTVPTTVFAAQVKNKVFPDPGFGMNLRSFPGVSYPIGD